MALIGANGGLIGSQRSTNTSTAPGLWTANEQVLLKRAAAWPLSSDPNFSSVSLLLHMDGTNGSTTFTDTSNGAVAVTASGNAQISTAQSKFGGASGLFDGSGDYLSCTLSAFNANDFTIESWIRVISHANYRNIYESRASDADTLGFVWGVNASGQFYLFINGGFQLVTGSISLNTWTHVALTRSAGTWRTFKDGVLQTGSYSNSASLTRTAVRIGIDWATLYAMNGYVDDYRVTNGVARYTANFTPPTAAFFDA